MHRGPSDLVPTSSRFEMDRASPDYVSSDDEDGDGKDGDAPVSVDYIIMSKTL